ncbi:MAG: hypothetical protein WKG00_39020 [Polyangiaceae bacterium]
MWLLFDATIPGDERARGVVAIGSMLFWAERATKRALSDAMKLEAWDVAAALEAAAEALQDAREATADQEAVTGPRVD